MSVTSEGVTQTPGVTDPAATAAAVAAAAAATSTSLVTGAVDPAKATPAATGTSLVTGAVDPEKGTTEAAAVEVDPVQAAKDAVAKATTPEEKAAAEKTLADAEAAKKADSVPEKYEIKLEEGLKLNEPLLEAFTPIAKELGLTQAQVQKLADFQIAQGKAAAEKSSAEWKGYVDGWVAEVKADKEMGEGAGGKTFAENMGYVAKAVDKFGDPAVRKALDDSGMGNHPAIARMLFKVGKAMSEGTFLTGGAGGNTPAKTPAQILFPGLS